MTLDAKLELVPIEKLREHEEILEIHVVELAEAIARDGFVSRPVVADARTLVVIDGHHRLNALRRLGARRVPVHLVDYESAAIRVDAWRDGESPPSKAEVVATALAGRKFPPKTTRHRVLAGLPDARVELKALL